MLFFLKNALKKYIEEALDSCSEAEDLKDIDKKKITPLMIAAKFGNYKNIKFILERIRDAQYINFKSD